MRTAVAHFQAGRLDEAKSLCAKILSAEPRNVMVLHLHGILHCQQGDLRKGAELLDEAVRLHPDNPATQYDLGKAWLALARLEDAAEAFRHALALKPDYAEAHNNLGNVLNAEGIFEADSVLAKHDENYMPREVIESLKKSGRWKPQEERPKDEDS